MSLDLYQLKMFFVFGKIRNFTQTAEKMYVTQSAVSHAIKKLEQSAGTKLVERRGGKYGLTEAGEMLFDTCGKVFHEIEKFEENLTSGREEIKQKILLGSPVEFGTTILVRQMSIFLKHHPNFRVHYYFSHDLEGMLMRDEVDLIVDCKPHHQSSLASIFLFREHYVLAASPGYLRDHPVETAKDLEDVTILSLDENLEWWSNFLLAQPVDRRPAFKDVVRINHVRGLINGAIEGTGVSFLPRYTVESELKQGVLTELFPGGQLMDDEFCIYIKKDRKETRKNKLMIDFLIEHFSDFPA